VLTAAVAAARPGGGESFSGGGGHGGGGHGGGGGFILELIFQLIRLCVYYPTIGIPLILAVIAYFVYSSYKQRQNKDWDSGPPVVLRRAISLEPIRAVDPEFSQVLFEDFAFRLFSTAHRARASATELATIAPYVTAAAQTHLAQRGAGEPVASVVVGAMRVFRADVPATAVDGAGNHFSIYVGIEFEANVTAGKPGAEHTDYSVESWTFRRDATRVSKPPGATKGFPCPNCGAPWQAASTGTQVCASCNQAVDNGRFDWVVDAIALASIDQRPPTLTAEVPERGTDLPTYRQRDYGERWAALCAEDPGLNPATVQARLALIYGELNKAWSNNQLGPVRGLCSDGLYDYLQYWVAAYQRQGLRNQLTDMRIVKAEPCKLVRDKHYDALTIRIWGTGKDFVIKRETGALVRGSKHAERPYSEYWTLIRSAARRGTPTITKACSNCGAPLAITMAGACEHCGAHLTSGEFDWVLSKIEQDDTYRG
jgi:hypothetical protein